MANADFEFAPALDGRWAEPGLYDTVRRRRIFAFLLDALVVTIVSGVVLAVIGVFGILTFGAGWLLYALPWWPLLGLLYVVGTLGSSRSATPGMRAMGLVMLRADGSGMSIGPAAASAIIFYVSMALLTPLILLVGLFSPYKRLLHDIVLGTVVVDRRVAAAMFAPRAGDRY